MFAKSSTNVIRTYNAYISPPPVSGGENTPPPSPYIADTPFVRPDISAPASRLPEVQFTRPDNESSAVLLTDRPSSADTRLAIHSTQTIAAIRTAYISEAVGKGQFTDASEAEAAIGQHETAIQGNHALTINMSAASVVRLVSRGVVETFWDHAAEVGVDAVSGSPTAQGKAIHPDYVAYRRAADDGLRNYAPSNATAQEPVFAAIAGPSQRLSGAAPQYGNWHIVVDQRLADRAVYNLSDSHTSVRQVEGHFVFDDSNVIGYADAPTAKAISELYTKYATSLGYQRIGSIAMNPDPSRMMNIRGVQPGYVEAAIFDDVTLQDIVTIHGSLNSAQDLASAPDVLCDPATPRDKLRLDCGSTIAPLVKSWITNHFNGEAPNQPEDDTVRATWGKVGLAPDAPYEDVANVVQGRLKELWPAVARIAHGYQARHYSRPTYQSPSQWHNHLVDARSWLNNTTQPQQRETIQEFIDLQNAGVFFK